VNKAVLRRIFDEVIGAKNLDLADELYSEEHELHPESPGVGRGPEGMKEALAGLHEEYPESGWPSSRWSPYASPSAALRRRAGRVAGDGLRALRGRQGRRELGGHRHRVQPG